MTVIDHISTAIKEAHTPTLKIIEVRSQLSGKTFSQSTHEVIQGAQPNLDVAKYLPSGENCKSFTSAE
jgi:hypothetical protein